MAKEVKSETVTVDLSTAFGQMDGVTEAMQQAMQPWMAFWTSNPWTETWMNMMSEMGRFSGALAQGKADAAPQNVFDPFGLMTPWIQMMQAAPQMGVGWTSNAFDNAPKSEALSPKAADERARLAGAVKIAPKRSGAEKPQLRVVSSSPAAEEVKSAVQPQVKAAAPAATAPKAKAAAPKPKAKPAPKKKPTPAKPDDLTAIKGVGAKLAMLLNDLGVTRFDQLAKMKVSEFEALDAKLGTFRGRWRRDDWAGQAKALAKK